MNILELRLADTAPTTKTVKVLRTFFPQTSILELRQTVEQGRPVFSCQAGSLDGKRAMMRMVKRLTSQGLQVELCEQANGKAYPLEIQQLQAFIDRGRMIGKQVLEDIEHEADGPEPV